METTRYGFNSLRKCRMENLKKIAEELRNKNLPTPFIYGANSLHDLEVGYLNSLEKVINSDESSSEKIQSSLDGYVIIRDLVIRKGFSVCVTMGKRRGKVKKGSEHSPEFDEKYKELEKLALEKGYNIRINSNSF